MPASMGGSLICRRWKAPLASFMLQQMAAIAEIEAGMISARTKAALQAAKERGAVLGGYRGRSLTARSARLACSSARAMISPRS